MVSAGEDCIGRVVLDGRDSFDPDGDPLRYTWTGPFGTVDGANPLVGLPVGTHVVTLIVHDGKGQIDTDTVSITVEDTTAAEIENAWADPDALWPPNHKMVEVTVHAVLGDICDAAPTYHIISVTSNEPINGPGDGNTEPDWEVVENGDVWEIWLRAERCGSNGPMVGGSPRAGSRDGSSASAVSGRSSSTVRRNPRPTRTPRA